MEKFFILGLLILQCCLTRATCPGSCLCFDEFVQCVNLTGVDKFPVETSTIVIENSHIEVLKAGLFSDLPDLKFIEIKGSHIETIKSNAFSNLYNLDSILLTSTSVGIIEEHAFYNISQVATIALAYCHIRVFNTRAVDRLSNIDRFEIKENNISIIRESAFVNMAEIKTLEIYLNMFAYVQQGAFVNVTSSAARVYVNTFQTIACNTLDNIFMSAKKVQFYSNQFKCNCKMAWMFQNYLFTRMLSNNMCSNDSAEFLKMLNLQEADAASAFTTCRVSNSCFKSAPTTPTTTTAVPSTRKRTTKVPSTTMRTTTVAPSTTEFTTTAAPSTTEPKTKRTSESMPTVTKSRVTSSSPYRTNPATTTATRTITRGQRLTTTSRHTEPMPTTTQRVPISHATVLTSSNPDLNLGRSTRTPQTTKSPRVSREMTEGPDVGARKDEQKNLSTSLYPGVFLPTILLVVLWFG